MEFNEIINIIKHKYFCELADLDYSRRPFLKQDYKWTIGVKNLSILTKKHYIDYQPEECMTIFDIVVEVDFHNADNIKLFKEVGI